MGYFTRKEQVIVVLLVSIIAFISIFAFINKKGTIGRHKVEVEDTFEKLAENENKTDEDDIIYEEENIAKQEIIMVHICGQVNNPGIIELESGSRVIDAVELAGGLKKTADSDRINLSSKLLDEEKVYIPEIGEEDLPIELSGLNESNKDNSSKSDKVNINTCTKEELTTLSGIGDVLAERILDYREGNLFKTIDDIKNVSGIGDKKYESIEEIITIK